LEQIIAFWGLTAFSSAGSLTGQLARSKERGNSFAGGQGAGLHSPCTPGRERTATGTPSRLTFALFAVNKICVNLCNLWFNFFYLFSVVSVPSVAF